MWRSANTALLDGFLCRQVDNSGFLSNLIWIDCVFDEQLYSHSRYLFEPIFDALGIDFSHDR